MPEYAWSGIGVILSSPTPDICLCLSCRWIAVLGLGSDLWLWGKDIDERADAKDKTLPEGKKFEAGQQVDPDDPLQHSSRSLSIIGTGSPRREPARIVLLESR